MALDGFVIRSIVNEFKTEIVGCKIDKIYQPESEEMIFNLRGNGQNKQLLLSANSSYPRVLMAKDKFKNPESAPAFCMFMRKHLTGGIIKKITQINLDRIIMLEIEAKNELRTVDTKRIFIEIMGKHSNIIITNADGMVLECIKRIGHNISSKRQVYPGVKYTTPNFDKKINPLKFDSKEMSVLFQKLNQGVKIDKAFVTLFDGMSPLLSREICFLGGINDSSYVGELTHKQYDNLSIAFEKIMEKSKDHHYDPTIYINAATNEVKDFHCFRIEHLSMMEIVPFQSINEILNMFYREKSNYQSDLNKSSELRKTVSMLLEKNRKKLGILKIELEKSENREKYKTEGALILATLYKIKPGDTSVEAEDYSTGGKVLIELDERLTPAQNAQKAFKKYNKLKIAEVNLKTQIDLTNENIVYLDNVLFALENTGEKEVITEIKEELFKNGYIKKSPKTKAKSASSKPLLVISKDGYEIIIGKNNLQNDYITFKIATKDDLWFHAKDTAGSHVIVRSLGRTVPDSTIVEAASYAAYFSKSRNSDKVEVIYTLKSHVKKPSGSKPGLVTFTENYSLMIAPQNPIA
jgi:predicted ribosome quality control (RQC) complex YloA/Tae2 family protein